MSKLFTLIAYTAILPFSIMGQSSEIFDSKFYPARIIDTLIIQHRGLDQRMQNLLSCEWETRKGKKVDVFWLKTERGNFFAHVYEYFMKCDNVRLIYWSTNAREIFPIVDFMIEDLEEDSRFVSSPKKHLKNKKKYKKYLSQPD